MQKIKINKFIKSSQHAKKHTGSKNNKIGIITLLFKIGPKAGSIISKFFLAGASFASYAVLLSWEFAALIMISLFIHESGHIWAMKKVGMKTKGIYFIPFVGGAAVSEDNFPSREAEVFVAIMGPIWGFLTALFCAGLYLWTGNLIWAASSSWIALINLFNLLPINPLDGGRIAKAIAFTATDKVGYIFLCVGLISCLFIAVIFKFWLFILIAIVGALELIFQICLKKELYNLQNDYITLKENRNKYLYNILVNNPGIPAEEAFKRNEAFINEVNSYLKKLKQEINIKIKQFGGLSRKYLKISIISYLVVISLLFGLMKSMDDIPGADIAAQFLEE